MSAVPVWERFMAPALRVLSDGEVRRARDICEASADLLGVTEDARVEFIPSGQPRYVNRSNWALSYLARAGAVERPSRGRYRITRAGRALLEAHPDDIVEVHLRELPDYDAFAPAQPGPREPAQEFVAAVLDPTEQVDDGIRRLHEDVAAELLQRLHANEPAFFEQAVLDLLLAMGYGGAEGRATRTQLSRDGGIDGIIDQDALGLSRVYVQAKRYAPTSAVQRPEVQAFGGALQEHHANQGVFITTGRFSSGAEQYANTVASRIVLVDGSRLTSLMIRYGVGVQVKRTLQMVEIDEDFFE